MARVGKRREQRNATKASREAARVVTVRPGASPLPRIPGPQLLALAVAILLAFGAAVRAPFQFDDVASIDRNPTIERLWPPSAALNPPRGIAVSGRPVVNYTLAVNHALNDLFGVDQRADAGSPNKTVGYHVVSLLIHALNGLLLLGIIRRTIRSGRGVASWSDSANEIATVVVALWLLHPLQSEAVDYVIQRTELLVTACYLTALYASIRAWDAGARRSTRCGTPSRWAPASLGCGAKRSWPVRRLP
jgi:hypothetical protein